MTANPVQTPGLFGVISGVSGSVVDPGNPVRCDDVPLRARDDLSDRAGTCPLLLPAGNGYRAAEASNCPRASYASHPYTIAGPPPM